MLGIDIVVFSVSRVKNSLDACPLYAIHTSDITLSNVAVSVEPDQVNLALGTQFSVVRKYGVRAYPERRAVSMPMLRELRLLVGVAPPYNVNLTGVIFKASVPEISKKGKTWRKLSLNDGKGMWVEVMVSGSIAESPMIQLNAKVVINGISARLGVQPGEKGSFWLYDSGHFICLPELAVAETANVQLLLRALA